MSNKQEYVGNIVCIIWVDSWGGGTWVDKEDFEPQIGNCETWGKCIKETKEFYAIASTFGEDQYMAPICIPKKCVKQIINITL